MVQHNVLAMSGKAVEAAGDVDVLLLDKTGTITLGNRQATEFIPRAGRDDRRSWPTRRSSASLADETPEGRSIVVLAKEKYGIRGREIHELPHADIRALHRADAHERRQHRTGRVSARAPPTASSELVGGRLRPRGRSGRRQDHPQRRHAAGRRQQAARSLGVIHLKDIVKGGLPDRFTRFRAMGIKTVMITGDNPLTAAAIADGSRASMISSPRPRRRTSWRCSARSRPPDTWWP